MSKGYETSEQRKERLRQAELKSSSSSMHGRNLADLAGGPGWKGTGIVILILLLAYLGYTFFFR
ncbi:hypothetical protein JNUCC1_02611 [Lentibacillus sp. JNUCC-1]|uniref:DUF6366 family protein n=1 Tax=Lentibacillus sp. JNUCC-1 TaxID=2654513 RepID=UPI0012E8BAE5|nr:DUF6366 family protein [Lentibacillus sp. JNUCC-1]MUV38740.1 hypothetical protein [Lentibacillus sp. JNUCC-1]